MIKEITEDDIRRMSPSEREDLRQLELRAQADRLYATYGKPLEDDHWGKFVAISPDGRVLLGETSLEVLERASEEFGSGNFIFKVGERVVGRIR